LFRSDGNGGSEKFAATHGVVDDAARAGKGRVMLTERSLLFVLLVAVAGCGGNDGPRRVAVTGTVTRDGAAVEVGSVAILPDEGQSGPGAIAAVGAVEGGEFEFDSSDGPAPGPHVVIIRSMIPKDELMRLQSAGQEPKMTWVFPVEIPNESSFHQDFVLE
jgi:hypothetical protein